MLKLWNQRCLAKTQFISSFLRRPGFVCSQFSTATAPRSVRKHITVSEFEEKFGIPWKSTCLPLSSEVARKIDENFDLWLRLAELWGSTEPEYPVSSSESPQPGESLEVSFSTLLGTDGYLIRNNGDRVDLNAGTFKGKYVLVCCFHVPPRVNAQLIINACEELYSSRDDVEVVMAAWMNSLVVDDGDQKQVFDRFFSAFPKSCLSVPFEDSTRRAHVCKLVSDYDDHRKLVNFPCLLLDTEGKALPPLGGRILAGAAAFPYTQEITSDIRARALQLKKAGSLEQLLLVNSSSPDFVYKFNPEGGPREEKPISELNNKLVGLYMPHRDADLFPNLVETYKQCKEKQLEFEIVVALSAGYPLYDHNFNKDMVDKLLLQKRDICRHWWCLPFNNSVSLQLNRVMRLTNGDKFSVVGSAGGFIDHNAAGPVIKRHGVDGYPFTREGAIRREVSEKRQVTLESVFSRDELSRGTDPDDVTSAVELLGKKVSAYFGCLYYMLDYEKVVSSYHEMKAKDPGFEVVFVYLKNKKDGAELLKNTIYKMPWALSGLEKTGGFALYDKRKQLLLPLMILCTRMSLQDGMIYRARK